jgi:hypothetical protein
VPWCNDCDRYLSPSTVRTDGTCPSCGHAVDLPAAHAPKRRGWFTRLPWQLKLLLIVFAGYVAFRLYQGITYLVG